MVSEHESVVMALSRGLDELRGTHQVSIDHDLSLGYDPGKD